MKYNKEDFHKFTRLYIQQKWLSEKDIEVKELINNCDDINTKKLIFSLLERFFYLDQDNYNLLQNKIVDYIFNELGFDENRTQILSLTWDDEADSSQAVLQSIKHKISKKGWENFITVNKFGKGIKYHNTGRNQIIIVDEFIGSGKTLRSRINYLKKNIVGEFEFYCFFIAGIESTINELIEEGINIFCPLPLEKGISEFYHTDEIPIYEESMLNLELKLAQKIKEKNLYDYSFGYGNAQALYTMEGCGGNTPNSVFLYFQYFGGNKIVKTKKEIQY